MKLLVTNDDGVAAPGINALCQALSSNPGSYNVTVVAPSTQRSAASQSFTFGTNYIVEQVDDQRYHCTGTPTDCVMFGLAELGPFDAVLSGINQGANVAWDIWYSGTVGAAFEASRHRVPAFALSLNVLPDTANLAMDYCYDAAAQQLRHYLSLNLLEVVVPGTVVNINFPNSRTLISKTPRLARPGSYSYNQQLLIRERQGQSSRWHVHIEHRERSADRAMAEPESDGALVYTGPTIEVLRADLYRPPYEEERRLRQWIEQLL